MEGCVDGRELGPKEGRAVGLIRNRSQQVVSDVVAYLHKKNCERGREGRMKDGMTSHYAEE